MPVDGGAALIAAGAVALGAVATAALLIVTGRAIIAAGRRVIARVLAFLLRRIAPRIVAVIGAPLRASARRTHALAAFRGLRAPPFAH